MPKDQVNNPAVLRIRMAKKERERKTSPSRLFLQGAARPAGKSMVRPSAGARYAVGRQLATVEGIKCGGVVNHLLPDRAGRFDEAPRQAGGAAGAAEQRVRVNSGRAARVRSKDGASIEIQLGSDELVGEVEGRITTTWWRLQNRKQLRLGIALAPYNETGTVDAPSSRMILPESLSERTFIGISGIRG